MTPEDEKQIARLNKQIQVEKDPTKVAALLEELIRVVGRREQEITTLPRAKSAYRVS
jgi:hypothetical protein